MGGHTHHTISSSLSYFQMAKNTEMLLTKKYYKKQRLGTSLVAQWLRIQLPVQETWVRSLVQEDPTCRGTAKPVSHNY